MVPDAATIARRRHLLRTVLRCVALGLLLVFAAPVVASVAVALINNSIFREFFLIRVLEWGSFLLAGILLLIFEKRLVAWLVPLGSHRCPQCDYFLVSLVEPRCPECGLPLTREFVDESGGAAGRR